MTTDQRWGLLWASDTVHDSYFIREKRGAMMFKSRDSARRYNMKHFRGITVAINERPELARGPDGWRMPEVVKIDVHDGVVTLA